jgi:hypothetical protein|tara:strand:+ start:175 stop:441 length:267 start_codon:yes stop_codon:yes gene_type:complete
MTVIEQIKQELTSLAPKKVQDCEALAHRLKELMAKVLVVGYKSGFQDAASLVVSYADGHFKGNKDFNKESEEIATEKLMDMEFPEDAA